MANHEHGEYRWSQIATFIQQKWQELSDTDLQQVQGDLQNVVALIEEKTGWKREAIKAELDSVLARGAAIANQATQAAADAAGNAGESVQERYEQAEQMIQQRPVESVAVAFGVGIVTGLVVGLVLRTR